VLASTHGDGHVRESAVKRILAAPEPRQMPFLVLRTADWVKPVRDRARAGLALLLADRPETYLPAVLGMTLVGRARQRGGFAHTQAVAALLTAPPTLRDQLLATADRAQRRLLLDIGLSQGWWPPQTLFALAVAEPDVRIRARAAEVVCRQAVWSRQIDVLRRLARHPRPEVRAVALTGLLRVGHDADVAAHLDDTVSLVRAIAREAARRTGIDALDQYRAAVVAADPAVGAIAGLAETGSQADGTLLRALLAHPAAQVRAQTVRALRHLDAVPAAPRARYSGAAASGVAAGHRPGPWTGEPRGRRRHPASSRRSQPRLASAEPTGVGRDASPDRRADRPHRPLLDHARRRHQRDAAGLAGQEHTTVMTGKSKTWATRSSCAPTRQAELDLVAASAWLHEKSFRCRQRRDHRLG
jgi:hypothetical protein